MNVLKQVQKTVERAAAANAIVIGVSGGPDSLTLLHTLVALRERHQLKLIAVHVDHQLRGEAAREDAAFVEQICAAWLVSSVIESVDVAWVAAEYGYTVEEAARRVRYTLFAQVAEQHNTPWIAVGHNADDQAETVLMHLIRGTGLEGLTGMQTVTPITARSHFVEGATHFVDWHLLLRPLLGVSRPEIEAYCRDNELQPRIDATNQQLDYTRSKIRHKTLPAMQELNPNIVKTLSRTANLLHAENEFIGTYLPTTIAQKVANNTIHVDRQQFRKLHLALKRRLLVWLMAAADGQSFAQIEQAVSVANASSTGAKVQVGERWLHVLYDSLLITASSELPEPIWPELTQASVVRQGQQIVEGWRIEVLPYTGQLSGPSWDAILEDAWAAVVSAPPPYMLRVRRVGDQFQPQGTNGTQSIKKFMNETKIPAAWRSRVPLLLKGDDIVWVCGFRVDQRFIATEANQDNLWHIRLEWFA